MKTKCNIRIIVRLYQLGDKLTGLKLCMEHLGNYALECKSTKGYKSPESGEKENKNFT
jgi:hypothetical protein